MTRDFECSHFIMARCITSIYRKKQRLPAFTFHSYISKLISDPPVHSPLKYSNKPFKDWERFPMQCWRSAGLQQVCRRFFAIFQSPRVPQISVILFTPLKWPITGLASVWNMGCRLKVTLWIFYIDLEGSYSDNWKPYCPVYRCIWPLTQRGYDIHWIES